MPEDQKNYVYLIHNDDICDTMAYIDQMFQERCKGRNTGLEPNGPTSNSEEDGDMDSQEEVRDPKDFPESDPDAQPDDIEKQEVIVDNKEDESDIDIPLSPSGSSSAGTYPVPYERTPDEGPDEGILLQCDIQDGDRRHGESAIGYNGTSVFLNQSFETQFDSNE